MRRCRGMPIDRVYRPLLAGGAVRRGVIPVGPRLPHPVQPVQTVHEGAGRGEAGDSGPAARPHHPDLQPLFRKGLLPHLRHGKRRGDVHAVPRARRKRDDHKIVGSSAGASDRA